MPAPSLEPDSQFFAQETQEKSSSVFLLVLIASLTALAIIFGALYYLNIIRFDFPLPFVPKQEEQGSQPNVLEVDTGNPPLPININEPIVAGASVYYRLIGMVEQLSPQDNGDLDVKITQGGKIYPQSFTLKQGQTVVTEKGQGFTGFSFADIKAGDKIEIIYTVDLKTFQSLVTQAQIERSGELQNLQ